MRPFAANSTVSLGPVARSLPAWLFSLRLKRPVVEGEPEAITHHKMRLTFGEALDCALDGFRVSSGAAQILEVPPQPRRRLVYGSAQAALACASMVPASLTSNLPGPSILSVFTTPSTTNME